MQDNFDDNLIEVVENFKTAPKSPDFQMNKEQFSAIMGILVAETIHLIAERDKCDEMAAADEFYSSKVYALLEDEETKVWHFSPLTLANMFDEEKKKGTFELPEED